MPIKEKKKKRIVIIPSRSKLITKIPTTIANTILLFLQGIDATFYLDIVRKFHKNIIPSSYTLTLNKHPSLCLRRIFTYTELTSLNLNFAGREILAIDHLTNLHSLSIHDNNIEKKIIRKIGTLTQLRSLTLNKYEIYNDDILRYITKLTQLTYLNLNHNETFSGGDIDWLTSFTHLTTLGIAHWDLEGYDLTNMQKITKLTTLDVSYSRMDNDILEQISKMTTLTRLKMDYVIYHGPEDDGHDSSPTSLAFLSPLLNLTSLSISAFKIEDVELKKLNNLPLTALNLAYCPYITDVGLLQIVKLTTLTRLSIRGCNITEGINYLSSCIHLVDLDIYECKLTHYILDIILENLPLLSKSRDPTAKEEITYFTSL